ncbi:MAG: transglutaminase family protein [Methanoregulaceae archaeon]
MRDKIRHSGDHQLNPVTLRASGVLKYRTGYCYAKSHLLAALLRANGIPTGLCYQRLAKAGEPGVFFLHGLNAVYLKEYGWYRIDARGNRPDLSADCSPPLEALPYSPSVPGEADLSEIWAEPLPCIVGVLTRYSDYARVNANLPDVELIR